MINSWRNALLAVALAVPATYGQGLEAPAVPTGLQPPAGNVLYFKAKAWGTQNYICLPRATGFAWVFTGPQATLFINIKWVPKDIQRQVATHFLSMNPSEEGVARATWQSSFDSSAAWGKSIASSTDDSFVEAGAIPWLLLEVVGWRKGPAGGTMLSESTYVQRVNTSGGVAPSTGCTQASQVGETALVPYSTDYLFYKANQ